jgi:hypothetical protein
VIRDNHDRPRIPTKLIKITITRVLAQPTPEK